MSRNLILKFNNYNDSLQKSIDNGEYALFLELLIDDEPVDVYIDDSSCTRKVAIPTRRCKIGCNLHFKDSSRQYCYILPQHIVNGSEEDVVFSFNMYGYRYDERDLQCFDFGPGEIPQRPPKKCYVATCVYGSYDCPQVWTLRRYRDDILAKTWYGRVFIRTYYFFSPTLVKWFGETKWFTKAFKPKLDKLVDKLNKEGVSDTPYNDHS